MARDVGGEQVVPGDMWALLAAIAGTMLAMLSVVHVVSPVS